MTIIDVFHGVICVDTLAAFNVEMLFSVQLAMHLVVLLNAYNDT
jgi:hypothetical protein